MSPKKAAARICVPANKYCTRAGELLGVISGFTAVWNPIYLKGKTSRIMLKVKMLHPLLASI